MFIKKPGAAEEDRPVKDCQSWGAVGPNGFKEEYGACANARQLSLVINNDLEYSDG